MSRPASVRPASVRAASTNAVQMVPRWVLIASALAVATAIVGAASARIVGVEPSRDTSAVVSERALLFADQADGSVAVRDASDGQVIDIVAPGTNGFLRAVMRGLARTRKMDGTGRQEPFRVALHADHALTLEDPTTGRQVVLQAFGPTNAAAFGRLLASR